MAIYLRRDRYNGINLAYLLNARTSRLPDDKALAVLAHLADGCGLMAGLPYQGRARRAASPGAGGCT